jgi:hypothetical protein
MRLQYYDKTLLILVRHRLLNSNEVQSTTLMMHQSTSDSATSIEEVLGTIVIALYPEIVSWLPWIFDPWV